MDTENTLDQRRSTYKDIVRKARQTKRDKDKRNQIFTKHGLFNYNKGKQGKDDTFLMKQLAALAEKNKLLATSLVQSKHLNNELEQSLLDVQHTQMAMLMKFNSKQVELEDTHEKLLKAEEQNKKLSRLLKNVRKLLDENLPLDDDSYNQSNLSEISTKNQKPQRIKIFLDKETKTQLTESDNLKEKFGIDEEIISGNTSTTEDEILNKSSDRHSVVISDTSFDPDNFMFDFDEQIGSTDNSTTLDPVVSGKRQIEFEPKSSKKRKQSCRKTDIRTEATDIPDESSDCQNLSIATPLAPRLSSAKCSSLTSVENNANQQNSTSKKSIGEKTSKAKRGRKSRKSSKPTEVEATKCDDENLSKKIKLESIAEDKENKLVRRTWPLPDPEDTKSKLNRYSESSNEAKESIGRSRRNKKPINYLEPSLGKKLRQGDKMGEGWLTK